MSGTSSNNLNRQAGIPLRYSNGELATGAGVLGGRKSVRRVEDLNPVLFESRPEDKRPVYYVWRDLRQKKDADTTRRLKIRYDITALAPEPIGKELPKT
ncbi:MAG: glucose-6-phosphate isomerase family protein, partial [Patescibacteria group bacterium]